MIAEELQAAGLVCRHKHLQEQPPEQCRQHLDAQKVSGRHAIHLELSADRPPPGTTKCICGWCVSAEPHVCSTDMKPMRAPRCRRVAAILSVVSADALNSRS